MGKIRVGQGPCTCGIINFQLVYVHSDIQGVCRSSRLVTALVLKFTRVQWGAIVPSLTEKAVEWLCITSYKMTVHVFLSYPHGRKMWTYKCALIGVNRKLAAYKAEASLALCYKLVDAIRVYTWSESKTSGIILKSEFSQPVALAYQQYGCHWNWFSESCSNVAMRTR